MDLPELAQPMAVVLTNISVADGDPQCFVLHPDGRQWILRVHGGAVYVMRRANGGACWGIELRLPSNYTKRFNVADYRSLAKLARHYCV